MFFYLNVPSSLIHKILTQSFLLLLINEDFLSKTIKLERGKKILVGYSILADLSNCQNQKTLKIKCKKSEDREYQKYK